MNSRKNQMALTAGEWDEFITAVNKMHGMGIPAPRYRDFVKLHVDAMSMGGAIWAVHTMAHMGVVGRNFLAWHRQYLMQFEHRLQAVDPNVTIPYWDWTVDRAIPAALSDPAVLDAWGVARTWDPINGPAHLPTPAQAAAVISQGAFTTFSPFQTALELGIHGQVHVAVGGDMNSAHSPSDPIFWLHHANIDRLWANWQTANPGADPANTAEVLQPAQVAGVQMFGIQVSAVLDITALQYQYV